METLVVSLLSLELFLRAGREYLKLGFSFSNCLKAYGTFGYVPVKSFVTSPLLSSLKIFAIDINTL